MKVRGRPLARGQKRERNFGGWGELLGGNVDWRPRKRGGMLGLRGSALPDSPGLLLGQTMGRCDDLKPRNNEAIRSNLPSNSMRKHETFLEVNPIPGYLCQPPHFACDGMYLAYRTLEPIHGASSVNLGKQPFPILSKVPPREKKYLHTFLQLHYPIANITRIRDTWSQLAGCL